MHAIAMKSRFYKVKADSSHIFISQHALLGRPLKCSLHRVKFFIHILCLLYLIDNQVGIDYILRIKDPEILGILFIPSIIILKFKSSFHIRVSSSWVTMIDVLLARDFSLFNGKGKLFSEGFSSKVEPIVFVWTFR